MARKPTIYPELIKPGDWHVEEWRPDGTGTPCPCTDNEGRRMFVPAGQAGFPREVRFHELLHVKYSPAGVPDIEGVTLHSLLASEDCRVNHLGAHIREHDALQYGPKPDPFMTVTQMTERGMARLAVASLGYASSDEWLHEFDRKLFKLSQAADLPDWVRSHATTLRYAISRVQAEAVDFLSYGGVVDPEKSKFEDAIELAKWLDDFPDDTPGPKRSGEKDPNGEYDEAPDDGGDASDAKWGDMRVEEPPLTMRHPTVLGRRTTPSTEGSRIQHFNRLATGEIFGRTRKRATPDAVLIDDSGSMGWDADKFYNLVKRLPVGVIAAYSGGHGKGMLRVLARDGRMVAPDLISTPYGGNEVDGPALRWLAEQKGRKIWVSDQGVCSDLCDDEQALLADCKATMAKAGIRVCLTTDPAEIMKKLRGR